MMYRIDLKHTTPEVNEVLATKIASTLLVNNRHAIKVYDTNEGFTVTDQLESKRLFQYKHNECEFIYQDTIQMLVLANLPNHNTK